MRNRYSGLLAIVLTSTICANAQSIDGKVMENDSIPVPYATVSLLQASDSAYVAGVIGGEDGSFSFDTNSSGKIVKVSCIGYKTVFLPAAAHMTIHLLPSEQALQGVTVTASRPSFKMEQGQFVTHIQGTVFSQLGMATDVLQQLPLIDTDGIKVLGRGVPLVYINNKRMRNWNELTRIPSNMIKDVKIDMNPGAKYGSSVRAVLYITTIKPVGEGLGGSLILSENVSSCWNTTGWLDLNYRRRGLDFFVNTSANTFSNSHYKRQDVYDFQYKDQDIHADYSGDGYNSAKTGFVSVGVNDQLTDRQSLGATYTFSRVFSNSADQNYRNHVWQNGAFSEFDTRSTQSSQNGNHNVSAYYENKFSDKFSLNVDATYAHNRANGRQIVVENRMGNRSMLVPATKSESDMAAQRTVFSSTVANGKLDYGLATSWTRFQQQYCIENEDYSGLLKTNDNESKQSAAHVFANYSRSFGRWFTQLGLKYEYIDYKYYAASKLRDESKRTFRNLLPSVSLSYSQDRFSLMLSYNIYTNSSSYSQLDDGLQYISDFRYNKGNSQLQPTKNHSVAFNVSYRDLLLICNYSYGKDAVVSCFDVMDEIPAVLSYGVNHSFSSVYTGLSYSPTFFKIWRPSWHVWIHKQWLSYNGMEYGRPQAGLQWKNLVVLPRQWYIVLNASGNLKGHSNTYMAHSSINVGMSIQKNMKNLWVKLAASNLFNAKEKGYSEYNGVYTSHWVDNRQPSISLTISYSFNPAKSKYKGKTAGEDELRRL